MPCVPLLERGNENLPHVGVEREVPWSQARSVAAQPSGWDDHHQKPDEPASATAADDGTDRSMTQAMGDVRRYGRDDPRAAQHRASTITCTFLTLREFADPPCAGRLSLDIPATVARYSRNRCARGWPRWSAVRIPRIEGTRLAADSASNTAAGAPEVDQS
jgi:hypothetical protein